MKKYLKAFCIICLIFAALYLIAIADLEYGYYTFIRILSLFGMPALGLLWLCMDENILSPVMISPALILILFNPILPVYLDKETWVFLDAICAAALIITAVYVWFKKRNITE